MSLPQPTLIAPAGSRMSLDERSVRPFSPASQLPLFERSGRPRWGRMFHSPFLQLRVGIGFLWGWSMLVAEYDASRRRHRGRSGPSAGCGVSGRWVEMAGFGDGASAFGLDAVGPEDAEPVPGSAAGGEFAGL